MKNNLIRRQDALDICNNAIDLWKGQIGEGALIAVKDSIAELPSAEPEIAENLYLCKCYVTDKNGLSTRSYTYRRYKEGDRMGDLISRQDAIRLAEQGQIQGFEWQFKKLCVLPSSELHWIPNTKETVPKDPLRKQIQLKNGWIVTGWFDGEDWYSVPEFDEPFKFEDVVAWCELPSPYQSEEESE